MSEITFIVHVTVNEGKEAEARSAADALVGIVRENEDSAKTLQYDACISEDGRRIMMMERYADAGAVGAHMENAGAKLGALLETVTVTGLAVVGDVPPPVRDGLAAMGPTYYSVAFSGS